MAERPLRIRWLGRVPYREALGLQHGLFRHSNDDYLLLLEHPPVYTLGVRATEEHVLVDPSRLRGELVRADRGGDVTYHGPGQLVGYPIVDVPMSKGAIPDYVHRVESLIIDVLHELGLSDVGRLEEFPGVWVEPDGETPRKICAIGVRVSRGRSMHGFALNVEPDLTMFDDIVPCGIVGRPVTSLAKEGLDVSLAQVVDVVAERAAFHLQSREAPSPRPTERQDASQRGEHPASSAPTRPLERRLVDAGVRAETSVAITERKPEWLRVQANIGKDYLRLRKTMRSLDLVTVCEEAGCPNIYECWSDGTATFMINGERCTRACGFCQVDTSHPLPLDESEPQRVAHAVADMGLSHAVVTAVARDDLDDGGAAAFVATVRAIRARNAATTVEVLIPDLKGDETHLRTIFDVHPDVLNHNLETVLRLQRAVRPSASYARSLGLLARAKAAGLTTKSGLIVGMGETDEELLGALSDLSGVGVDIVTIGQYLRPSVRHLPIDRYATLESFDMLREAAEAMGFAHVECSPLARSSYHARRAVEHQSEVASA